MQRIRRQAAAVRIYRLGTDGQHELGGASAGVAATRSDEPARDVAEKWCVRSATSARVAVHAYHAQANRLPAAWSPVVDSERFVEAWSAQLLPYIEQQACADRLRSTPAANLYQDPDKLAELQIPTFLCPSDIAAPCFALTYLDRPVPDTVLSTSAGLRSSSDHRSAVPTFLPSANYIGVFGTVEADEFEFVETQGIHHYGDGSIVHDVRVRLDDLQHGTAQTIVVGERTMAKYHRLGGEWI